MLHFEKQERFAVFTHLCVCVCVWGGFFSRRINKIWSEAKCTLNLFKRASGHLCIVSSQQPSVWCALGPPPAVHKLRSRNGAHTHYNIRHSHTHNCVSLRHRKKKSFYWWITHLAALTALLHSSTHTGRKYELHTCSVKLLIKSLIKREVLWRWYTASLNQWGVNFTNEHQFAFKCYAWCQYTRQR